MQCPWVYAQKSNNKLIRQCHNVTYRQMYILFWTNTHTYCKYTVKHYTYISSICSPAWYNVWSLVNGDANTMDAVVPWPEPTRVTFSAWNNKGGCGEGTVEGLEELRSKHTVTVPCQIFPSCGAKNSQDKFSAEQNRIGRNCKLIEITSKSLSGEWWRA